MTDLRRYAPATARNREPILAVLSRILPLSGLVLEISAGTGEHAAFFAAALPHLRWQPTDMDERAMDSIAAHCDAANLSNLLKPIPLDASSAQWPVDPADAIVCINMIHIAPWSACEGLMAGAARTLPAGGLLYLYGPFKENRGHTAESNLRFDIDLRSRDVGWGVRDLEDVVSCASTQGFRHSETVAMPANNRSVIFVKAE
jgi:cyclopropane fatty-acyl-phospholipid synthase-like methyltransferase